MTKMRFMAALVACLAVVATGCQTTTEVSPGTVSLCGECGWVKGTERCCDADAATCACGLHTGSIGCCKMEKGSEGTLICTSCGHFKGTEECCRAGDDVCACGLHKGSPACCKLDTTG